MRIFAALPHVSSLFRFNSINDIWNFSNKTVCFVVVSEVYITPQGNILGWKIQLMLKTEEIYVNMAYAGANNLLCSRAENLTKKVLVLVFEMLQCPPAEMFSLVRYADEDDLHGHL